MYILGSRNSNNMHKLHFLGICHHDFVYPMLLGYTGNTILCMKYLQSFNQLANTIVTRYTKVLDMAEDLAGVPVMAKVKAVGI